jgi:sialidase-1
MKPRLVKESDVIVYKNPGSYSIIPCVELLRNGDLVCVFRDAKRRRVRTHIDMTSKAAMVTSRDGGRTWDPATHRILHEEKGCGIQDPSIRQLRDDTLICNYFVWTNGGQDDFPTNTPWIQTSDADHYSWVTGAFTIRSTYLGRTWETPVRVPSLTGNLAACTEPVLELASGELLIPFEMESLGERAKTGVARSRDAGRTWVEPTVNAFDPLGHYNFYETTLLQLSSGKIVALHRVHQVGEYEFGWYLYQTESLDDGRTWTPPVKTPMWGGPANLIRLQSGSLLAVYGYRRPPFGVRACLSHDDGKTWDIAHEFIIDADGIDADIGYPNSVQLKDGTIFTAWYRAERDGAPDAVGVKQTIFAYDRPLVYIAGAILREA